MLLNENNFLAGTYAEDYAEGLKQGAADKAAKQPADIEDMSFFGYDQTAYAAGYNAGYAGKTQAEMDKVTALENVDWNNITNILNNVSSLFNSTPKPNTAANASKIVGKSNTGLYVGIGIGVVAIVGIIIYSTKK